MLYCVIPSVSQVLRHQLESNVSLSVACAHSRCFACFFSRTVPHHYTYTGIDYVGYAMGATDKFQGTGVFSGIKMEREPKNKLEGGGEPSPSKKKEETQDNKTKELQSSGTSSK